MYWTSLYCTPAARAYHGISWPQTAPQGDNAKGGGEEGYAEQKV